VRLETLAVHAGHSVDVGSGAIAEPITLSVTYERDPDGEYSRSYFYSSKGNPNRDMLEACMAALERGRVAVAFSSGTSAITAVLRTLHPGDHVIVPDDVFQGTIRLLRDVLPKWGIAYDVVDLTDASALRAAIRGSTKLVWTETLSNPLLKVTDLEQVAAIAHERGILCVVDNTFLTPVFQRPLELGVDLVVHASTKYIGGHGDVLGGVVVALENSSLIEEIRQLQLLEGAVPSPFDCWLVNRGLKTLAYRMRGHANNAMKVARFLESHPIVDAVHYPGLESHPQYDLAKRHLEGSGGVVSFQMRGGRQAAIDVAAKVKLFTRATSLGTPESLIQHQASSPTHGTGTGLAENLLRISVGLEHPDDLIEDLDQALNALGSDGKGNP
jgi:cystathionine gamma-synthase